MTHSKPDVIGVIPARYGSTRLRGKPLIDLCGKPMVQHTYERASRARSLDVVLVATDDGRIYQAVKQFGGTAVMTPTTCSSGSDRIAYVLREMFDTDIVVNIQVDEPLLAPQMIDDAVRTLIEDEAIQVATLVKPITDPSDLRNVNIPKVVLDREKFALYFSRAMIPSPRDDGSANEWLRKHVYYKHIGLYVYRRNFLIRFSEMEPTALEEVEQLEQLRILENGYRIKCTITERDNISVDTLKDVERIRELMKTQSVV
ncbi:MAG: 3-deoxy-manno-octulosonate cytidylyltransferase [Bacteroidota bacterium]